MKRISSWGEALRKGEKPPKKDVTIRFRITKFQLSIVQAAADLDADELTEEFKQRGLVRSTMLEQLRNPHEWARQQVLGLALEKLATRKGKKRLTRAQADALLVGVKVTNAKGEELKE